MKDIHAVKGRYYISRLVEEGEHERQDFKFLVSDARKIARSVSAFANNAGGHLLVGVKDNGVIAGIRNEEDIYMIETAAESFCSPPAKVAFTAYKVEPGVVVVKADIPPAAARPVFVREADNRLKAYFRVNDENIAAHPLMLRAWSYEADDRSSPLVLSEIHNRLVSLISAEGFLSFDNVWRQLHISVDYASEMVARMVASRILRLTYIHGNLVIPLADPSYPTLANIYISQPFPTLLPTNVG